MIFLRETRSTAEHAIAKSICDGLADNKRVLWLVSGGSNIAVQKAVMDMVHNHAGDKLAGLAVMPIDERYGPSGHKDGNMQQLREAGFDAGAATVVDVLVHDVPFDQTVQFYADVAATALANADVIIGQLGMGADGHVAGIKPDSPAAGEDESTVAGYDWEGHQRLTLMPAAFKQITTGFLVAYGADKKGPLTQLQHKQLSFKKLPAMVLYEIPEVYVYNDQIESEG